MRQGMVTQCKLGLFFEVIMSNDRQLNVAVQTVEGEELALFRNQHEAEQWCIDQIKNNRLKLGTFLVVEKNPNRCPHCGEKI